ncbi:hypothetical protein M514_08640 [Trichuris suis]|uniref:Pecanex-like protein n=1 Tax=Trichuris suis TaxID=68888 RepID=A0A085N3I8_9BILA|nr:hypothetical protein M514_08640 [Trichuris suis]
MMQQKECMIEEIKRLLEEIIESHPEALQAIESVRQAKLKTAGLMDLNKYPKDLLDSLIQDRLIGYHENNADSCQLSAVSTTSSEVGEPLSNCLGGDSVTFDDSEERSRALLLSMMQTGKHMAASHDDTSEGAMHCFQDLEGNWWSYTFSSNGTGTAQSLGTGHELKSRLQRFRDAQPSGPSSSRRLTVYHQQSAGNGSTSSEESLLAGMPSSVFHPVASEVAGNPGRAHNVPTSRGRSLRLRLRTLDTVLPPSHDSHSLYPRRIRSNQHRFAAAPSSRSSRARDRSVADQTLGTDSRNSYPGAFAMPGRSVRTGLNQMRVFGNMALLFRRPNISGSEIATKKVCYSVPLPVTLFGRNYIKIHFDRLRLSSLFDRNLSWISLGADVALAVVVSVIAFLLLMKPYYRDFGTLFLCFSAAGAQFCLLKSVQPDAASPVHGYNSIVPYSRPVYFSIFGTLIILIDPLHSSLLTMRDELPDWHSRLDSISAGLNLCQEGLIRLILFLPLLFTLGVLPQLNTFCCYLLEQVDMHIFGGTACFNLVSAIYCCARSIACVAVLFLFGYLSISRTSSSQSVLFSAFCGFMVFFSYLLSRSTSNPKPLFGCLRCIFQSRIFLSRKRQAGRLSDCKESINNRILELRLRNNFFLASSIGLLSFALHCSTVFTMFPTILGFGFSIAAVIIGAVAHYVLPQLRKHTPCIFLSRPVLKTKEYGLFDVNDIAKVMWFERLFAWLHCIECHVFYPTVILSFVTKYGFYAVTSGNHAGIHALVLSVAGLKLLRSAFSNSGSLFLSLGFSLLVTLADGSLPASHLILTFYLFSMLLPKLRELMLKLRFIFAYVAPWQISWGSAFHAFAQPCAISHSALTLVITAVSSFLSAPLNPFMGSSVFLMSYVRPVKFWEKDYNTKHLDNSNTRLATQIDRGPTTDDSNLNAIFYEHLTRSLQEHLAGDLVLGRFASELEPGDCFILASFYLNCLIHVIEIGNGFVTFQLRGLEFRGTYCQQREVEAITEDISDVDGCCCAGDVCRLPGFVTWNAAWNMRWLAWEIKTARYILDGYSVTDNSAISLFQLIELRKLLITLYVKCIIYFAIKSNRITDWLQLESIIDVLDLVQYNPEYVDVDPTFCYQNDEDYDVKRNGISYESFCVVYLSWITCCADRSGKSLTEDTKYGNQVRKMVVALCYLLSLFGRRLLGAAAQSHTTNAESFLYGLHALFKVKVV